MVQLFSSHCYATFHLFLEMKLQDLNSHIIVVVFLAMPTTSCKQTWLIDDDTNFTLGGT